MPAIRLGDARPGALVAINALRHLIGSVVTRSYSLGLISGLLLWLPLGVYAIEAAHRMLPSFEFLAGLAAGVFAQLAVATIAVLASRLRCRAR